LLSPSICLSGVLRHKERYIAQAERELSLVVKGLDTRQAERDQPPAYAVLLMRFFCDFPAAVFDNNSVPLIAPFPSAWAMYV
jgi:hypothetical protein